MISKINDVFYEQQKTRSSGFNVICIEKAGFGLLDVAASQL